MTRVQSRSRDASKSRPLLAYIVQEEDEGTGGVVFARHAIVARRNGANEYNGGDFYGLTCRRAPWADRYAPGPVPKLSMIDRGWWFECSGCQRQIKDEADPDSEFEVSSAAALEIGDAVYCSSGCRRNHLDEQADRKSREELAKQRLRRELWEKVPGITLLGDDHAYVVCEDGRWVERQVVVYFSFPGAEHGPSTFRYEIGHAASLWVPGGDHDAWLAWRRTSQDHRDVLRWADDGGPT